MASTGQISVSSGKVFSIEDRRALVQRVVSSRGFEKSTRMRDLLAYVCSRSLEDGALDIREHEIGCAVFGRPDDYDTGEDNIVRVNASQVRKKLEAYFAGEGATETLILELPKGKYVPAFRERPEVEVSSPVAIAEPQAPVTPVAAGPSRLVYAVAALAPLLMIACIWMGILLWRGRAQGGVAQDPAVNALWSQLVREGESTDIVLTDSSLGLLQDLLGRPIGLSEYLQPETWRVDSLAARPELQTVARLAAHRRYTSLANVNITRRIQTVAGDQGQLTAVFARDFNIRQMKSDNVVLIGSRRANPWVELVEGQLNFRFGYDAAQSQSFFENRQPRAGEAAVYRNSPAVSYCDLAFLPNLSHTGNVLVISGTEMEGTEAGGEFLTTQRGMATLQRYVKLDSSGRLPYFEALLRSSKIGGAAPGFEVIAARVLARTP